MDWVSPLCMCVGGPDLDFMDTLKMSLNFCLSLTGVNLRVGSVINRIEVLQLSDPFLHCSQLGLKLLDLFFHVICLH